MSKYCGNCGNQIVENAYICPKCGVIVNNNLSNTTSNVEDKGGMVWSFLGFLFPLMGFILYLLWKDSKTKSARSAGKGALISVIIGVILYVVIMVLFGIVFTIMTLEM